MQRKRLSTAYAFAGLSCAGLVAVVLGSFLPWFRSGGVLRDSYETAALAGHFTLGAGTFVEVALRSWIAVPLLSAGCVVAYALRLFRTAATFTAVLAIFVGTVALVTAVQGSEAQGYIGVATGGPWTSSAGAITALIGAIGTAVTNPGRNRTTQISKNR